MHDKLLIYHSVIWSIPRQLWKSVTSVTMEFVLCKLWNKIIWNKRSWNMITTTWVVIPHNANPTVTDVTHTPTVGVELTIYERHVIPPAIFLLQINGDDKNKSLFNSISCTIHNFFRVILYIIKMAVWTRNWTPFWHV